MIFIIPHTRDNISFPLSQVWKTISSFWKHNLCLFLLYLKSSMSSFIVIFNKIKSNHNESYMQYIIIIHFHLILYLRMLKYYFILLVHICIHEIHGP